jgi:hypothetical protein
MRKEKGLLLLLHASICKMERTGLHYLAIYPGGTIRLPDWPVGPKFDVNVRALEHMIVHIWVLSIDDRRLLSGRFLDE